MSLFEGIWIPLVTPFTNGQVDLVAAQRLTADFVQSGVHGLVVCGTTGEASAMNEREQELLLSAVLEAAGDCPVLMGIGGSNTTAVTQKVVHFNQYPIAGLLVSAPCYVRPSPQGIQLHFQAISEATDLPIVLYNIPARTGVNIDIATVMALSHDPHFVGIKECSGNMAQLTSLINSTTLKVLCGDDTLLLATFCMGGHGAISAAAHIRPDLHVQLFELVRGGYLQQARALFNALLPLITLLFSEPNPGPVKAALALQGKVRDELRMPMLPMSTDGKKRLAQVLEQVLALPTWPVLPANRELHGNRHLASVTN